jgi:hypothetical protein
MESQETHNIQEAGVGDSRPQQSTLEPQEKQNVMANSETDDMSNIVASIASEVMEKVSDGRERTEISDTAGKGATELHGDQSTESSPPKSEIGLTKEHDEKDGSLVVSSNEMPSKLEEKFLLQATETDNMKVQPVSLSSGENENKGHGAGFKATTNDRNGAVADESKTQEDVAAAQTLILLTDSSDGANKEEAYTANKMRVHVIAGETAAHINSNNTNNGSNVSEIRNGECNPIEKESFNHEKNGSVLESIKATPNVSSAQDSAKSIFQLLVGSSEAAELFSDVSSKDESYRNAPMSVPDKIEPSSSTALSNLELEPSTERHVVTDARGEQTPSRQALVTGPEGKQTTSRTEGCETNTSDKNPDVFMRRGDASRSEPERIYFPLDEQRQQLRVSSLPQEVQVPTNRHSDYGSGSPPGGPPSTVSNVSTTARESPVTVPTWPTIDRAGALQNTKIASHRPSEDEGREDRNLNFQNGSSAHGVPPRSPAPTFYSSQHAGQGHPQATGSPLVFHDVISSAAVPHPSNIPVHPRQGSRVQESASIADPPSVSGVASINPATAMDVLTQHLLQNLEGKLVAHQQQQVLQQQQHQQQYALQTAPSNLSGYSTPIGVRSALVSNVGGAGGSGGGPMLAALAPAGAPYNPSQPAQLAHRNSNHGNGYHNPAASNPPAHVAVAVLAPIPAPASSGKRSIRLELMEHSRSDLYMGRNRSYAASARDLLKGAAGRHTRESSLFNSISRFRSSHEPPETPVTPNASSETPQAKKYTSRGTITVCWYEGTTTSELQTHVRNTITRKLGREVDNIRLLDPSSDYSEVVLTPHIPTGSNFVVRFTEAAPLTPVRTIYKYGEPAPDSPSAAPSPSPSSLELTKLPSLDLGPARGKRDHKLSRRSSTDKAFSGETKGGAEPDNSVAQHLEGTFQDALSNGAPLTIHEESANGEVKGEKVLVVQASRSQEKKHVVFVIANYFVLFLSFIAVMAELHERAPTWINDQYSQVQACAVDRDTLFECVSNGDMSGLIASFFLWVSKSTSFKRFFLFGFSTRQQLWIVIYESLVTSFCWGISYIFIRRGLNPDTRRNFITKYWKDAVYGALAGFNASFMKAVLKNLIPREAVEEVFVETQQLGLVNILGRMFRPPQPVTVASIAQDLN